MGCCLCKVAPVEEKDIDFPDTESDLPVKNRKETDRLYFGILATYLVFLIIIVSAAGIQGDIRRLLRGYDDYGNLCGYRNKFFTGVNKSGLDLRHKKYLDNMQKCTSYGCNKECVEKCKNGSRFSFRLTCMSDGWQANEKRLGSLKSLFELICVDIALFWKEILVLCFFSIGLTGLVLTILRKFPMFLIKTVLVVVSVASVMGVIYCWVKFAGEKIYTGNRKNSDIGYEQAERQKSSWMTMAIIVTIFTILFFVMLFSIRKKLKLMAALFEEGGKCIEAMPMLLLQPVLTHISVAVLACFLCLGWACFQTSGLAQIESDGKVRYPINTFFKIMRWVLLFGFIWFNQFIMACQNLVIAGAVSSWYFTRIKSNLIKPIWNSLRRTVKYHLGSAALGSLIIAIIKAIRALVKMMERSAAQRNKGIVVILFRIISCLLACLESCIAFVSKHAYIMIAIYGEPFCASTRRAFKVISANSSRVHVVDGVGTFILLVIELFISFLSAFIGAAIFKSSDDKDLTSIYIPTVVVFILSYLCCHCFISVYDMTIDTLIMCFCVDCETNDGIEKPYYMSRSLLTFITESGRDTEEGSDNNGRNENNVPAIS